MNNQSSMPNYINDTKKQQIYFLKFILLILAYGINGTTYTSIPFLFYRTKLNCTDQDGIQFECSLEQACNNPYGFSEISNYPQIYSLTQQLQIYCDREIIEAWLLTFANIGKLIAYIILLIFPIKKEFKEIFMNISIIIVAVQLCLLQWIQTTSMFIIAFFVWFLFFNLFYGLIYAHIAEAFPESIQKYGASFINMSWPAIMCLYIVYAYYFGSWQNTLIHFTGIPLLFIGLSRLYLTHISNPNIIDKNMQSQFNIYENSLDLKINLNEPLFKDEKSYSHEQNIIHMSLQSQMSPRSYVNFEQTPQFLFKQEKDFIQTKVSVFEKYFPFIYKDKQIQRNFFIWTFGMVSNAISYVGCYFFLNALQGNLYFNCLFSTIFEVIATVIATFLVLTFNQNLKQVLTITYFITGVSFISCLFIQNYSNDQDEKLNSQNIILLLLQLFPVIIAKISFEITWSVLVAYQKNVIPTDDQQSQFSCSNLITIICTNFIPFYKYICVTLGYNPFIGFGLLSLSASYLSMKYEEIQNNNEENDIELKEINLTQKTNSKKQISGENIL